MVDVEEDVFRLQVAVHDTSLQVKVVHCCSHFGEEPGGFALFQHLFTLHVAVQIASFSQFEQEEQRACILKSLVATQHVWVLQAAMDVGLPLELLLEGRVAMPPAGELLEREVALGRGLHDPVHRGKAARAEAAQDSKALPPGAAAMRHGVLASPGSLTPQGASHAGRRRRSGRRGRVPAQHLLQHAARIGAEVWVRRDDGEATLGPHHCAFEVRILLHSELFLEPNGRDPCSFDRPPRKQLLERHLYVILWQRLSHRSRLR
mmetsp:Transcript_95996/g.309957  ORF Transcript_95996/g.309957 Transcript_95996/m.309957 type:complete len:262 (+) Transcript_95996:270-1055(+)